jgi:hypothetical protein
MTVTSQPDPSLQVAWPPVDADAADAGIAGDGSGVAGGRSRRAGGWEWLLLLAPVLCCGWPLLIAAVAALGVSSLGPAAGTPLALVVVLGLGLGLGLRRRKMAAAYCCPVDATGRRR